MSGARPLYLSCALIIEEGLDTDTLDRILQSMQETARKTGVQLVTGDTKVVDRGQGDGLFINTAGIGVLGHERSIAPGRVQAGDAILVSGDLGRHGMAVMACREGLEFESAIASDCASLAQMVDALLSADIEIHCLRDLTRGGLASALNEIADVAVLTMQIDEAAIPVSEEVRGACEILGLDPLTVANEGRMVAFVPAEQAGRACAVMQEHDAGAQATAIGSVSPGTAQVILNSTLGVPRILDRLSGALLPRIC
jgi:hydrogenase expression/formation protein HypE